MDFPTSFSYSIQITKTRNWVFKESRREISSRETTTRYNKSPDPCQKPGDKIEWKRCERVQEFVKLSSRLTRLYMTGLKNASKTSCNFYMTL